MRPPRLPELRRLLAPLGARRAADGAPAEAPEAPDAQLQEELARRRRARARAARERRLRTLMEPPETEPPVRTLTRQAMEQIRYLRQLSPEEWPLARLAQGFHVQPEVIRRVLKSRFCPSPERSRKQDARASSSRRALYADPGTGDGEREDPGRVPAALSPLPVLGPGRRR